MHASERYDVLVEKVRECNQELDAAKEVARSASTRFEEVKRLRQQLFQNCYRHVSETLGVIYKDLTKSSKHPLGRCTSFMYYC
jgi:structural maintenance of chromosome 1